MRSSHHIICIMLFCVQKFMGTSYSVVASIALNFRLIFLGSFQKTPSVNTFSLVSIPLSCLQRAQLTNIYFLHTHLSFHCISRSLSLALKNKACNFSLQH